MNKETYDRMKNKMETYESLQDRLKMLLNNIEYTERVRKDPSQMTVSMVGHPLPLNDTERLAIAGAVLEVLKISKERTHKELEELT